MRTKFITTMAAATLLTISSTAVALAQAADVNSATNPDVISDMNQAGSGSTQSVPANAGFSVHHQQLNGHRAP